MKETYNQNLKKTRLIWIGAIVLGVILIIAIGGSFLAQYRKEQVYAGYIDEGDRYYSSRQYEKAVVSYRKAIDLDNNKVKGYEGAGRAYIGMQEYSMARVFLKKGHEITRAHTLEALYNMIEYAEDGTELDTMEKTADQGDAAIMDSDLVTNLGSFTYKQYTGLYGEGIINMEGSTCVVTYDKLNAKAYYVRSQENPVVNSQTGKPFDGEVPTYVVFKDLSVLFPMWEDGIPFHTLEKIADETPEIRVGSDESNLILFRYLNCSFEIECDEGGNIIDVEAANKVTPMAVSTEENMGTIMGSVVDATNGLALDSVSIKVVDGTDSDSGAVIQEGISDGSGEFSVTVPEGSYTVEYSKDGYITYRTESTVRVSASSNESLPQVAMSPNLGDGEWRIVLQWGSTPEDLDLHVISDDYHVYYQNNFGSGKNGEKAILDTDDRNGEGPETITITNMQPDVRYEVLVENFSYRSNQDDEALSASDATVTVYTSTGDPYTYTVPAGEGNVWNVLTIENGELKEQGDITRDENI